MPDSSSVQAILNSAINPEAMPDLSTVVPSNVPTGPNYFQMAANADSNLPATQGELEKDLNTLTPEQLTVKYGDAAPQIMIDAARGRAAYANAVKSSRDGGSVAADAVTGILGSTLSGAVGAVGMGAGLVAPSTGAKIATAANEINQFAEDHQSDALKLHREAGVARDLGQTIADANQYKQDLIDHANHPIIAKFENFGREAIHGIENATEDPMLLEQGTVDNAGAILTNYALTSGMGALADVIAPGAEAAAEVTGMAGKAGPLSEAGTARAAFLRTASKVTPMASQTVQMGGMAFQQAVGEVTGKSFDDLKQTSQVYRDALAQNLSSGMSPDQAQEEARNHTAGIAGRQAALIAGPLAGIVAHISHLSEHPFEVPSLGEAAATTFIKQPVEGAIVNASQKLAQNVAMRDAVDPNTSIDDGLGKALGEGGLYGLTAAAAMQGIGSVPKIATELGLHAGAAAVVGTGRLVRFLANGAASRVADSENAKVSNEIIQKTSVAVENAPMVKQAVQEEVSNGNIPEEAQTPIEQYIDGFHNAAQFDGNKEITNPNIPAHVAEPLAGVTNRMEAIDNLARATTEQTDPEKQVQLASVLHEVMAPLEPYSHINEDLLNQIPQDNPIRHVIEAYSYLAQNAEHIASVRKADDTMRSFFESRDPKTIAPVSEDEINTPAGNSKIDDIVANAHISPETGNPKAIDSVLAHAENGNITLSDAQRASLQSSKAILEARQKFLDTQKANGIAPTNSTRVSDEVLSSRSEKRAEKGTPSATQFYRSIYSAVRSGDLSRAKSELADMGLFVQSMKNKAEAVNAHVANPEQYPKGAPYMALAPRRVANEDPTTGLRHWYLSTQNEGKDPFVKTNSAASIQNALNVHNDATSLTHVYNGLVDAFPQLGESKIAPAQIHPALVGDTSANIAKSFSEGKRNVADFADQHVAQQEAVKDQQAKFDAKAPADSIVLKNAAEATKPVSVPEVPAAEPVVAKPATEPVVESAAPEPAVAEAVAAPELAPEAPTQEVTPTPQPVSEKAPAVTETAAAVDPQATAKTEPAPEKVLPTEPVSEPATPTEPVDSAASDLPGYHDPTSSVGSEEKIPVIKQFFPKLVDQPGKMANKFHEAFTVHDSGTPPTRTLESSSPVAFAREALTSEGDFKKALGSEGAAVKRTLTDTVAAAYQKLLAGPAKEEQAQLINELRSGNITDERAAKLANLGGMMLAMHAQLKDALNRTYKNEDPRTVRELLAAGDKDVNRWARMKVLNLVEPHGDTFVYNQNLMEHAALAGLHWFINVGFSQPFVTDETIEKILGRDINSLPSADAARELFRKSYSVQDAKDGITNSIRQFWGVDSVKTADKAYTDGIPEAMAAEVMRGMKAIGLFTEKTEKFELGVNAAGESEYREHIRFEPADVRENPTFQALREYPGAIADAIVVKPEQITHLGSEEKLRVPTHQMNSDTSNTKKQQAAIDRANQTKHYLNLPLLNLYYKLGKDTLQDMFGGGATVDERYTNKADAKTRAGKNLTVNSAADHIVDLVNQMGNRSLSTGETLQDMEIHYEHNMSRVARLQMLGANNPQANKIVREVVLPTWSKLDLAKNKEHQTAFDLATAQALGQKVETMRPDVAAAKARELMNGSLAPVMDLLQQHIREQNAAERLHTDPGTEMTDGSEFGKALHDAFVKSGIEETPVALHALLEQARLREAPAEEKSAFRTPLYLEADGKTNGPMNAMGMLGNGFFSPNWVANIRKGGFEFGPDGKPLHALDKVDLYSTAADHTEKFARAQFAAIARHSDARSVSNSLLDLMHDFLPGVTRKGDTFSLDRKVAKNPLTIALYGSGLRGIAGKVSGDLLESIYSEMTRAARLHKDNPDMPISQALFPDAPNHAEKYQAFVDNLNSVFGSEIRQNRETGDFFTNTKNVKHKLLTAGGFDPVTFEASQHNFKALSSNMHEVLVKPLMSGIGQAVGEDVMNASKLLQTTTNKQSIVYSEFIQNEVRKALAARKNDPTWRDGDFLSQADFDAIIKKAAPLAPLAMNGTDQAVMMTKLGQYTNSKLLFNRALDGRYGTPPDVSIPGAAGVAGMPFSIISHGDAHMIQGILEALGEAPSVLPVFDGLHMPLDKIAEYSQISNKAAMEAWLNNPVASVRDAYIKMLGKGDMIHQTLADQYTDAVRFAQETNAKLPDAMDKKMTLAKSILKASEEGVSIHDFNDPIDLHNAIIRHLTGDGEVLNNFASSIDARHDVLREVGMSADQMASAAQPYHNGALGQVDTTSPDTIQADLNARLGPAEIKAQEQAPAIPKPRSHEDFLTKNWKDEDSGNIGMDLRTGIVPELHQTDDIDHTVAESEPVAGSTALQTTKAPVSPEREAFKTTTGKFGREDKQTGVRILSPTSLRQLARSLDLSDNQRRVLSEIFRADGTKDYKIVTGSSDQISKYSDLIGSASYRDMVGKDGLLHGFISTGEKTIYLIDPTPETLAHELVHAATYQTIYDHFNGEQIHPEARAAIGRLIDLKNQFMNGDFSSTNDELNRAVLSARAAIDGTQYALDGSQAKAQADSLNEFMAWTLANKALADHLKTVKDAGFLDKTGEPENPTLFPKDELSRFKKFTLLAKNVIDQVKSIFWKGQRAPAVGKDMFSNIAFNSGIVMREPQRLSRMLGDSTLAHLEQDGDTRIAGIRDAFNKTVVQHLDALPEKTAIQRVDKAASLGLYDAAQKNEEIANKIRTFFPLSMNEKTAFHLISTALQAHTHFDPDFINRATQLYNHVMKTVTPESFIDPTDHDQLRAEHNAQAQYNVLMGREESVLRYDRQGVSNILPSFVALAMVDKGFRDVLSKIDMPGINKSEAPSKIDQFIDNLGNSTMAKMTSFMSGDLKAKNVREALDAMAERINEHAQDEQTWLQTASGKLGGASDYLNDQMVNSIGYLSDKGMQLGDKLQEKESTAAKHVGRMVGLLSGFLSNKNSDTAAESLLKTVNLFGDAPVANAIKRFTIDLVGRTEANSPIYDMIKQVRSMVAQVRQNYREQVPQILAKKFNEAPTEEQRTHLYAIGKSDLASMMENHSVEDTLSMLNDTSARTAKKSELEYAIQQEDPTNWNIYQAKMHQLADYMMDSKSSEGLLTNAHAISQLLGERIENKPVLSDNAVRAIDQLTSLYALDRMSPEQQESVSHLVQHEGDGMKFLMQYLQGQRKFELGKVGDDALLRNNHYKGDLPGLPELGSSLLVAKDSDAGDLRLRGYTRVKRYEGSGIEGSKEAKSYYFSPLNGKTAFAQGSIQNIDHTVSGIDSTTGFSTHQMAGRITDPTQVARIAGRMQARSAFLRGRPDTVDATVEHLRPLYNENGQVYAFERMLDPKMTAMRNPSTDLLEMAGVWRGRQVEEGLSREVNRALIDRAHKMFLDESDPSRPGGSRADEYINVFDPQQTSKIQKDAVRLFNDDTKRYLEDKFGGDKFMVRKDLVDDVIGYRHASIGDAWTGNSNWSPDTQRAVRDVMTSLFGPDAFQTLVSKERMLQGFMTDVRRNIAVKSLIVPAQRVVDNIFQLVSRGVPLAAIVRGTGTKLNEIHLYNQSRQREVEIEAELQAATNDPARTNKLQAELQSIKDSYQRMSIAPLLNAGEFSTIAGVGDSVEDLKLSSGRVSDWLESKIKDLPAALQTPARYGIIARDTALFQGMERLAEYSDFVAKGIFYDDMTRRRGISQKEALATISEEYVNFDRLPGRSRSYTDNVGLTWFLNYKIRIAKVALNMLRNNPFHALVAAALPAAIPAFHGVGDVFTDNVIAKTLDGSIRHSIGPATAMYGVSPFGPWMNLVH